jgi:acetyl-CoA carboxylase carboxyltransferase component
MADVSIMVEDSGAAVSAPAVIDAAISEKVSDKEPGVPGLHQLTTGTVDIVVQTEENFIQAMSGS